MTTDTKKLRELLALATTRPWKANTADKTGEDWLIGSLGNSNEDGQDWIVTTDRVRASELDGDAKFDAALIVAAVNALPALCDEIDALRAERDRLKRALEPDMFWDWYDPEQPYYSIEEALNETDASGEGIIQVQEAIRCPDAAYRYRFEDDPDSDDRAVVIERLSEEEHKHYQAAMSVAAGAREMWRQMVDNLAAKLFAEDPGPVHAWMHGKPWSSIDYNYRKHHRALAHEQLCTALGETK